MKRKYLWFSLTFVAIIGNNDSSQIDGTVSKKIINLTNKTILNQQIRVPYSVNWR